MPCTHTDCRWLLLVLVLTPLLLLVTSCAVLFRGTAHPWRSPNDLSGSTEAAPKRPSVVCRPYPYTRVGIAPFHPLLMTSSVGLRPWVRGDVI